MSAMDGIKARQELREAAGTPWESLPELTDEQVIMHRVYDDERHCIAECSSPQVAELIAHAPTDLARLVAAVEAVEKVCAELDEVRVAESGWPDMKSYAATRIRAALAAALGQPQPDPMAEALNDPEGRALVQAIHDRKRTT